MPAGCNEGKASLFIKHWFIHTAIHPKGKCSNDCGKKTKKKQHGCWSVNISHFVFKGSFNAQQTVNVVSFVAVDEIQFSAIIKCKKLNILLFLFSKIKVDSNHYNSFKCAL